MTKTNRLIVFFLFCNVLAHSQGKYPSILWEIKKTPASKPSYLFGTYHISDKGVFKMGDSIFHALKKVDMVATEVNDDIWQQQTAIFDSMKNVYAFYNSYFSGNYINEGTLRKTNPVPKLPVFISFQPGAINYFLYRNTDADDGFEEEAFLDRFISSAGYKNGKKIAGLENLIESEIKQIEGEKDEALLDKEENKKLPDGLSEELINDMIFNGYKNNSLDMMDSLNKYTYSSKAFFNKFVVARNYDQADSLDYYIKQGNAVFAAVGAAHLPGAEGVIEIMRKKGYTVRPVKLSGHDKASIDAIKKKKVPVNLRKQEQQLDGVISFRAPGPMTLNFANKLMKIYSYVDMANGAYYLVSRMYNNGFLFGKDESRMIAAIDSLLYDNIPGDILTKKKITINGFPALDVVSQLKNKDIEKYRFVVTPYEAIKIKTGGKNDYANLPVVDSFFNSFVIRPETPLSNTAGISIPQTNSGWHTWECGEFEEATVKTRYTSIDRDKKILNGCIRLSIAEKSLNPDHWYHTLAAESITSSLALQKDESKKLDLTNIKGNTVQYLKMENGGMLAVKTVTHHPFLYLLYTATAQGKPDTSWMAQVKFNVAPEEHNFTFTDTMRGFSVKLPYKLEFDARWKAARERSTEKPDPDKKMNRNEALMYNGKDVYDQGSWELVTFQNPSTLDVVWGGSMKIDSNQYYPNAKSFWKPFTPKPYREDKSGYRSTDDESEFDFMDDDGDENPGGGFSLSKRTLYVTKLQYDTANKEKQQMSYILADSFSSKGVYNVSILHHDRVYNFQTIVSAPAYELPPFFRKMMESFTPVNTNPARSVYQKKMEGMVKEYLKADMKAKPDIAERMNMLHPDISNLPDIEKAMVQLKTQKPENNILRRKLMEMICESDKNPENWPALATWLKKVYHDESELLTIRIFAITEILERHDERDLNWVLENAASNPDFRGSEIRSAMAAYFKKLPVKDNAKTRLTLSLFGKTINTYGVALTLYDSGYFKQSEMKETFDEIVKLVEDEKISIRLKAEGDYFKYPEKSDKKNLSDLRYNDNFLFYTSMFTLYYSALPTDSFFTSAFPKIMKDGTPKDKLTLLTVFARQKKLPEEWAKQTLQSLAGEKTLYLDIFRAFSKNKKEHLLPEEFRNRTDIAQSYLKQQAGSYRAQDTIYFLNSKPSPYHKGETFYFFKYRNEKEENEQIAYVILPENLSTMFNKKAVRFQFSDEQLVPGETMETISARLMRRHFINRLYDDNEADFYLEDKDEKSLDQEE